MPVSGDKLLSIRTDRKLTQDGVANKLRPFLPKIKVKKQHVHGWEKSLKIESQDVIDAYVKAFDLPEVELRGLNYQENITHVYNPDRTKTVRLIGLYDTLAIGGMNLVEESKPVTDPIAYIDPGDHLRKATGALNIYGDSMFPTYPSGSTVGYIEADLELIFWGEDYILEFHDGSKVIKRIEPSQTKGNVLACSYNTKHAVYHYDPVEVPIKKIKRIFKVLGVITLKASI